MALPRMFMWRIVGATGVALVAGASVVTWEWFRGTPVTPSVSGRTMAVSVQAIQDAANALGSFVALAPSVLPTQFGNSTPFAVPEERPAGSTD
ncbi:hypothetical protein HYV74_00435 [Candidatus Uhrbacteria bacterium]|nr:hypothetical protein [Candidatus Uhrbacteria bacterium]